MKRPISSSIKAIAIGYIAALSTLALGLAAFGYVFARDAIASGIDDQMVSRMAELHRSYRHGGIPELTASIDRLNGHTLRTFSYLLVDHSNRAIAGAKELDSPASIGWSEKAIFDRDDNRMEQARLYTERLGNGAMLSIVVDRDIIDSFDLPLLRMFAAGLFILLALALIGGMLMARLVRSRLEPIRQTARAIVEGRFDSRAPLGTRADEFHEIAGMINAMLDRINAMTVEVRRTTSFLAHDLRAPLLELERELAGRLDHCIDVGNCKDIIGRARERCTDLRELFDAILRISQTGGELFSARVIDLSALVIDLSESFALIAEEQGSQLDYANIVSGVTVRADQHLLSQLIVNLLDNAVRHATSGASIEVTLQTAGAGACLRVSNAADRSGHARASQTEERLRFGLALVRAICSAHGGTFEIERDDVRFTAIACLPITNT